MTGGCLIFVFGSNDLVLIGAGSCAAAAVDAAQAAGASMLVMGQRSKWRDLGSDKVMVDLGSYPANKTQLRNFAETAGAPRPPRVFLAGDIPKDNSVEASRLRAAKIGIGDTEQARKQQRRRRASKTVDELPPGRIELAALEDFCANLGLMPTSLHDVWIGTSSTAPAAPKWSRAMRQWVDGIRDQFGRDLADLQAAGKRAPDDFVLSMRETALAPRYFEDERTLLLSRIVERKFDAAFVDLKLIRCYLKWGVRRMLIEPRILIFDEQRIRELCAAKGIEFVLCGL